MPLLTAAGCNRQATFTHILLLDNYITDAGRLHPRKRTGLGRKVQNKVVRQIKVCSPQCPHESMCLLESSGWAAAHRTASKCLALWPDWASADTGLQSHALGPCASCLHLLDGHCGAGHGAC